MIKRQMSKEHVLDMPLWYGVGTPNNLPLVGCTPSGCPLRRNTGLVKCTKELSNERWNYG
jgi:hypothetical protein